VPLGGQAEQVGCEPGTYQPNPGGIECLLAAPGSFVAALAAAGAIECRAGTYQPDPGQAECIEANPGHFVPDAGAIGQTACPDGWTQPAPGQATCLPPEGVAGSGSDSLPWVLLIAALLGVVALAQGMGTVGETRQWNDSPWRK
jgi:hypothetical protein